MPSDLVAPAGAVVVRDAHGLGLPFSRGLLATSILATGCETDLAYAIASDVQRALARRGAPEIDAAELADLAARTLAERNPMMAQRYLAWRRMRAEGRPLVVILGGAPGVGKSTVSTRLAVRLGITRIVTTDTIREVLRTVIPPSVLPELHVSTYEAAGAGAAGPDVYLRQARVVGAAVAAVARRLIAERRSAIVEGVHLLPGELATALAEVTPTPYLVELMLTLDDAAAHRAHLAARASGEPARGGQRALDQFEAIRALQALLVERAGAAGVVTADLVDPRALLESVLERVLAPGPT